MGAWAGGEQRKEGGPAACPQRRCVRATRGSTLACSALPHAEPGTGPPAQRPLRRSQARGLPCPAASTTQPARAGGKGSPLAAEGATCPARAPLAAVATAWPPATAYGPGVRPSAPLGVPPLGGQLQGASQPAGTRTSPRPDPLAQAGIAPGRGPARRWGLCTYIPGNVPDRRSKREQGWYPLSSLNRASF